jgi:hypothetical protein
MSVKRNVGVEQNKKPTAVTMPIPSVRLVKYSRNGTLSLGSASGSASWSNAFT